MKAFHGDVSVKEKYLARVKAHYAADEIIHGQYWEDGKGCAVGCILHSGRHERFEVELGVPRPIAHLLDALFESLDNGKAKELPIQFIEAIQVGADLSMVIPQFLYWLLSDENDGAIRFAPEAKYPKVRAAIQTVIGLFKRLLSGEIIGRDEWLSARRAADAADDAACAAYAADDAAYAAYAAYAAACAADDACAYDAACAADAARRKARERQAEKLLELLRAAPMAIEEEVLA